MNARTIITGVLALFSVSGAWSQETTKVGNNPAVSSIGRAPLRSEFIGFDIREDAERGDRDKAAYYLPLNLFSTISNGVRQYRTVVDIPYMWLDRDVFLHVEGLPAFFLTIENKMVGYAQDSKTPVEFNISKYIKDGLHNFALEVVPNGVGAALETALDSGNAQLGTTYIYSQPKVRIEDYIVNAVPDSTNKFGVLNLDVAVANSYNSFETITIGYDIYSPAGKLLHYDLREVKIAGNGRDTVRFKENIYSGLMQHLWSSASPELYRMMIYVRRSGRIIEYIPFMAGFGTTEFTSTQILRNGKPIAISAVNYNAASDVVATGKDIDGLKLRGVNTICVDYPQPYWFYDLCDKHGMYVIDQANINSNSKIEDRNIGGALSNNPQWKNSYLERAQTMYERSRNHPSIIAWSLGGDGGNGYNMYKSYQILKSKNDPRPVIYKGAQGEWNSDFDMPVTREAHEVLATPLPKPAVRKR